jgi:hypothetical protein
MVNRTPKRVAKQAEPEYNDYFTAMAEGTSEVQSPADKGPDVSAQLEALMKRVDALQSQNDMLRSQYSAPPIQMVAPAPAQQQPEVIPDPILDSNGYAEWLLQRADALAQTRINAMVEAQNNQAASADAYDNLWSGFLAVEGNDVWEQEPEKVQVAAMKVSKKLQAKGIDPQAYMFQNTDKFYGDIVKTLETDFGKPVADEEDTTDDDDVDRTAGLMGGQETPVVQTKGKESGKGVPDMYGDLVSIQRKGGWY